MVLPLILGRVLLAGSNSTPVSHSGSGSHLGSWAENGVGCVCWVDKIGEMRVGWEKNWEEGIGDGDR